MVRNKRLRAVIIAGCALAVVAAVGVGVAFASPSGRARYVTASVGTGDVTQTYTTSGTVTRTNTSTAAFAVDGTVRSVQAWYAGGVQSGRSVRPPIRPTSYCQRRSAAWSASCTSCACASAIRW